MERIAIISDIHGNITALEAVIKDIKSRDIKLVYCLGDFVGKGPNPARAIDICRDLCENAVMGNWDALISQVDPGISIPEFMHEPINWHRSRIGPERIEVLERLPYSIDFLLSGRHVRLMHASPQGLFHRVFHNDPPEKHLEMFLNTEHTGDSALPDIVGYSDIHFAFQKEYGGKLLFNVGSVGNPLDVPTASYAVLTGDYGSPGDGPFSIEFVRVSYDIETEVKNAYRSGMPDMDIEPWVMELRTAHYRGRRSKPDDAKPA